MNVPWSRPLVLASMTLLSCGPRVGTDVGNGATVSVEMRGYDKAKTNAPLSVVLGDGTTVDAFWVVTSRFRVRPAVGATCSGGASDEEQIAGPLVADLVGTGFLGDKPTFDVAAGGYCRFRLDIGDKKSMLPTGTPPELEGASVFVTGTRRDGVPFRIVSRLKTDLRMDAKKGVPFELPEGESQLFVAFAVDDVLAPVGLDLLEGEEILVDDDHEKMALGAFERAFRAQAKLFRDRNDDGELDDDEARDDESLADSVLDD